MITSGRDEEKRSENIIIRKLMTQPTKETNTKPVQSSSEPCESYH